MVSSSAAAVTAVYRASRQESPSHLPSTTEPRRIGRGKMARARPDSKSAAMAGAARNTAPTPRTTLNMKAISTTKRASLSVTAAGASGTPLLSRRSVRRENPQAVTPTTSGVSSSTASTSRRRTASNRVSRAITSASISRSLQDLQKTLFQGRSTRLHGLNARTQADQGAHQVRHRGRADVVHLVPAVHPDDRTIGGQRGLDRARQLGTANAYAVRLGRQLGHGAHGDHLPAVHHGHPVAHLLHLREQIRIEQDG